MYELGVYELFLGIRNRESEKHAQDKHIFPLSPSQCQIPGFKWIL